MSDKTIDEMRADAKRVAVELRKSAARLRTLQGKVDDRWEDIERELQEDVLSVERVITYRVTLGTGGPAYGVDIDRDGNARAWWQEWFTERVYVDIDEDTAEIIGAAWGVDFMRDEDEDR